MRSPLAGESIPSIDGRCRALESHPYPRTLHPGHWVGWTAPCSPDKSGLPAFDCRPSMWRRARSTTAGLQSPAVRSPDERNPLQDVRSRSSASHSGRWTSVRRPSPPASWTAACSIAAAYAPHRLGGLRPAPIAGAGLVPVTDGHFGIGSLRPPLPEAELLGLDHRINGSVSGRPLTGCCLSTWEKASRQPTIAAPTDSVRMHQSVNQFCQSADWSGISISVFKTSTTVPLSVTRPFLLVSAHGVSALISRAGIR